jgi:hypothetical protein
MTTKNVILIGEEEFDPVISIPPMVTFFNHEDSGLLTTQTSGIILHRKGFGSEQIVYQIEPRFRAVAYKQSEGDEEDERFILPFPYVILLIAYEDESFRGIRHFYSPTPIYTLDQPLYMPSLPNTNCMKYNNTSLGWVCIYHGVEERGTSLFDKLQYALGYYDPLAVPYNYDNMRSTDGVKFYSKLNAPDYTYDPTAWQTKGEAEGLDWVLKPDTWIEAKVAVTDVFGEKYDPEGESFNLQRALYDKHYVYYEQPGAVLLNHYEKLDEAGRKEFISTYLRQSMLAGMGPKVIKQGEPVGAEDFGYAFDELDLSDVRHFVCAADHPAVKKLPPLPLNMNVITPFNPTSEIQFESLDEEEEPEEYEPEPEEYYEEAEPSDYDQGY